MTRIEELKAKVAAAEAAAAAKALTEDEQLEATLNAQHAAAVEALAAVEATRRANLMAARLEAAEAKAGRSYLCAGVDLVACFPLGKSPPADQLPGGGVIIVRNPTPEVVAFVAREVEHKKMGLHVMMAEVLCKSTVDPDATANDGAAVTLREFCNAYPEAASQAAFRARELGGAKAAAEAKRGQ